MKKYLRLFISVTAMISLLGSCKKAIDKKDLWVAKQPVASPVSDATCLSGAINGTMLAGKTYTVCGDIFVNEGDTLSVQEGVTIKFTGPYGIGVKGSFICLGTKDHPNWITYEGATKTDDPGTDPSVDSAYKGRWIGIIGGATCPMMILKWTHVEFASGAIPASSRSQTNLFQTLSSIFPKPGRNFCFRRFMDLWKHR